jgi:PAS domain S-box-containing protein
MNKAKAAAPKSRQASGVSRRNGTNGARRDRPIERARGNGANENGVRRSERKQLESAIQRYADLYEFAPFGYVTFDHAGRIAEVNLAACQLLQLKRDTIIGSPFSLCVVPDDLTLFLNHLVRCRAGDHRVESNLHLRRRTGEPVSVLLSSTPTTVFHNGAHAYQTAIVDLTERDRAEEALRAKEAELEQLVTQTPFMLVRCTRNLRYRYVSHAFARFVGSTPEELAGKKLVDVIGEEGLVAIQPHIDRVLTGKTVSYEQMVPLPHGPRFLHAVYVPDKDGDGEVIGWVASIIDITERKKTEAAAMRLAAVVQSSHDAVVAKTLEGTITDWNKSAERIFGWKAKEIIGKSILTLIPKDRHPEEKEIIRKIRRGESIDHYQTIRRRKDGKLIDVSLTISPVKNAKGEIVGVSKIARDITRQKKAERLLAEQARLLDLSNEAILVRDRDDRITYWNHGAEELYGYSAKEAVGQVTHKLLRTKHANPLGKIFAHLEKHDRWTGELVHQHKNGTRIFVMSHWALDRDETGERAFVLETNTDITARKHAELALQRSKSMLEKLVLQRTRALRVANSELESEIRRRKGLEGQILEISDREQEKLGQELHDGLCQQLTAIGFLTRATALRLKDHRVVQVDDLEKIAQLINGSVMDARNIARDLHKEDIDAAEFITALSDLVNRKIWQISCRLELKTKIDIENDNVASQLYRILREAILNANKHARATQVVLRVERSKNNFIFTVSDNGVGFKAKTRGHGLGFHIMKYRAESIGARLELESLKKGGARVTCTLPIQLTK